MKTTPSSSSNSANQLHKWLWPIIGLILVSYGLLAFNSGITLSPVTNKAINNEEVAVYIRDQADAGVDMKGTPEVMQVIPAWANLMAKLSSSNYAYGDDGVQETQIYYFSMSENRRNVLSTHMMLGAVLMITGFLQFWPTFRRRYRKAHRFAGVIYILAAISSMTLSGIHLVNTGIANTFNTYVFHIGLWIMLVGVLFSISMAAIALLRKDIARHLGWQALGFGFLLTAPLQRFDWLFFSTMAGDASFNEMNILVNTILFVQATMGGMLLFWLNRSSSPLKSVITLTPVNPTIKFVGYMSIATISLIWLVPNLVFDSLKDIAFVNRMVTESALTWLTDVVSGGSIALAIAMTILLFSAWSQLIVLRNDGTKPVFSRYLTSLSAIAMAVISFNWAYQLGMSSHEHSVAGTGFALLGTLIVCFLILLTNAYRKNEMGKAVESLQFLLLIATAPALLIINFWFFDTMNIVPAEYLAKNAAYEMATIGAIFNPFLIGCLLSVYSAETARYRIS
jgi:hypothetical protein